MPPIDLTLSCSFTTAVAPTQRVCEVASMFGLGVERSRTIAVVPEVTLPIVPGQIIFVTGASGGGKSTLLRLIAEQLHWRDDMCVLEFSRTTHSPADTELSIVETLGGTLEQAVRWLALAGLNDAFVMLRRPSELSDGQRYRFALAQAMAETERNQGKNLTVVLADEFGSTLDRMTARIVASNVRKWVTRSAVPVCFIAATAHDDLLEPLAPDVLVVQEPGEGIAVHVKSEEP